MRLYTSCPDVDLRTALHAFARVTPYHGGGVAVFLPSLMDLASYLHVLYIKLELRWLRGRREGCVLFPAVRLLAQLEHAMHDWPCDILHFPRTEETKGGGSDFRYADLRKHPVFSS